LIAAAGVLAASTLFVPTPAHAGGGCHGGGVPSGTGNTVELSMMCMTPRVLHTNADGVVTFLNKDAVEHNLSGDGWFVDALTTGERYERTFTAGTHVYSCTLHPGMVGAVVVGDGVGVATPVADVTPVQKVAAATPNDDKTSDRLPLGIAIGAVAGVVATVVSRRLRRDPIHPESL
jgi:plastocyanin